MDYEILGCESVNDFGMEDEVEDIWSDCFL